MDRNSIRSFPAVEFRLDNTRSVFVSVGEIWHSPSLNREIVILGVDSDSTLASLRVVHVVPDNKFDPCSNYSPEIFFNGHWTKGRLPKEQE